MGTYDIIYADPPWHYYGSATKDAAAGKHYDLMSDDQLASMPVAEMSAKRAVCFMWATGPRLDVAIETMKAWGFHYRGIAFVWVKTTKDGKIINGQGVRPTLVKPTTELVIAGQNFDPGREQELVIAGTTNKTGRAFPILTEAMAQVVLAPRGRHSEKPSVFRDMIVELCGDRPRVELFAREHHEGWDVRGNETDGTVF